MKKQYVIDRLTKIIDKVKDDCSVQLDKTDLEALMTAVVLLSKTGLDSGVREWINEVLGQYYDGEISDKIMAMMISYAMNAERMW